MTKQKAEVFAAPRPWIGSGPARGRVSGSHPKRTAFRGKNARDRSDSAFSLIPA